MLAIATIKKIKMRRGCMLRRILILLGKASQSGSAEAKENVLL
ncbi:hypothetical protein [Aneurinibacillus migulanus]|jgi:hypothetical protein|nr:hypothetical protein [Aneurinibacillus migulanus]